MGKKLLSIAFVVAWTLPPAVSLAVPDDIPEVHLIGIGCRDMEADYLPKVVACENFGADFEALKAQAVAARTYAYYRMHVAGALIDGQADQVYSCGVTVQPQHLAAVQATECQVLTYSGTLADDAISAFYVAGAFTNYIGVDPFLVPDFDPTNTEQFVTYNYGLTGADIHQTTLGFTTPNPLSFPDNRGCMSQNGSHTLSINGWNYDEILRFYYGDDITIEVVNDCGAGASVPACIPPDCNSNGIVDADDIGAGTSLDCNSNGVPDECELAGNDCNANGTPDECDKVEMVIWSDAFETNTAANWTLVNANAQNVATFNFNYSTEGLPPAPHSSGTTRGLKMVANTAALPPAQTGLSAYPIGQSFSGNYTLKWDMYISWNSGGSTEFAAAGINHTGTKLNGSAPVSSDTDGVYFAVDGDGDVAAGTGPTTSEIRDYNSYYGNLGGPATRNPIPNWDHAQAFFQALFPSVSGDPIGPSRAGSAGRQWVKGEISQFNGIITWKLNGAVISQAPNTSGFASGNIMLAYFDHFIGQSITGDNFVIYDNVRVTVPVNDCNANGTIDECDLLSLASLDCNLSGVPDECESLGIDACGQASVIEAEALLGCLGGPGAPPGHIQAECLATCLAAYDLNLDGDVDLADYAQYESMCLAP